MIRMTWLCGAALAVLAGCQQERYRSMNLGPVDYPAAYETALLTFRDYYPVESTDPHKGLIVGRPMPTPAARDAFFSVAPMRERAEMRIRRENDDVWADIRIAVEREQSQSYAGFMTSHLEDAPLLRPAQEDAPFTREQQEAWTATGTNRQLERTILNDLYLRLHDDQP